MTCQLLFEHHDGVWEGALVKDGLLYDYRKEKSGIAAEQIYLCKCDRVVRGMEALFVKLTDKENGFLSFTEVKGRTPLPPRSGEKLLVQVKKPPVQNKCAYVTCDITLAGKYLILLPYGDNVSVSRRVEDEATFARLERFGKSIRPKGMGIIMREESAGAEESVILTELASHLARWQEILDKASRASAPCLIDGGPDALDKMLRDVKCDVHEIVTNCPEAFEGAPVPVRMAPSPMTLFNVPGKLEKSLRRKVWLNSGGNVIVDPCEALTVFDVNSAKDLGTKKGMQDTVTRLNEEAAREIARLLRLRGIGGIVLIDFVDMQSEESKNAVIRALEDALRDDPTKTVIHGFTALGLMELSRKKSAVTLSQINDTPCPHCKGTGILENKHE
jgi:ribonuclease G